MSEVDKLVNRSVLLAARLWVNGESLEVDAPVNFPNELIDELRDRKTAVMAVIESPHARLRNEVGELKSWAGFLSEEGLVLNEPVMYVEAPLRVVTTKRVSWYAVHYLKIIGLARLGLESGGWGAWTPGWWKEREQEALGALEALREALELGGEEREA